MLQNFFIKRTHTGDPDFQLLIQQLDLELWNELNENQAMYDGFNKVPGIPTAVLVYEKDQPVGCGCFKETGEHTVEIKRMFVQKAHRGKGVSKIILTELEKWAKENGSANVLLETSIHFATARKLYQTSGYNIIPNYGPYSGLKESVCMQKWL